MTGPLVADLTQAERQELHTLAHSADRRRAVRAAIVLAAAEPVPAPRVAARLGVPQRVVLREVRRYRKDGMDALRR